MAPSTYVSPLRRKSVRRRKILLGSMVILAAAILFLLLARPTTPQPAPPAPAPLAKAVVAPPPPPPPPEPTPDVLARATLIAPDSVLVGETVSVRWTGPENPSDFVTLVKPEAGETEYGEIHPTSSGRILQFSVPDDAGTLEWRYIAGRAKKILGRAFITARPLTASLTAPGQVILGSTFEVKWAGPNRPGDFLTIVAPDASDETVTATAPVATGSPVTLVAPVDPGSAEIRYVTKGNKVLSRRPISIIIPVTTLFAPEVVKAGATFAVRWHGPDSPADSITLVPRGTPDGKLGESVPTANGSPLNIVAPTESGRMELRYMTGSKSLVLARSPIEIEP